MNKQVALLTKVPRDLKIRLIGEILMTNPESKIIERVKYHNDRGYQDGDGEGYRIIARILNQI